MKGNALNAAMLRSKNKAHMQASSCVVQPFELGVAIYPNLEVDPSTFTSNIHTHHIKHLKGPQWPQYLSLLYGE